MKKTLVALFATAGIIAGVSAASAAETNQTSAGQLTVKATLKEGCTINFGNGNSSVLDFGSVSALSDPMTQRGEFTIGCSQLKGQTNTYAATSVSLDQGNVTDSTITKRLLANGDDRLLFQVYQDSNRETIWGKGDDTSTPVYKTPIAGGTSTVYPYFVTLLAQDLKDKTSGLYQNTMIATVNYTANDAQ